MAQSSTIEDKHELKKVKPGLGLPYGVVMATAGASILTGRCGLPALVVPLLGLAILQALWVLVAGMLRHRAKFASGWRPWFTIGPASEHTGIHTVPLGLAVIASGLAGLPSVNAAPWPLLPLAGACLGLAWLLTIVCVGRFLWSLIVHGLTLKTLDGTWFLVPAALLGAAVATENMASLATGRDAAILSLLALSGAVSGWLGYWAVAAVTAIRVRRFGLGGVAQAPWWIVMGCAGLAAAASGSLLAGPISWPPVLKAILMVAMCTATVCAVLLFVPLVSSGTVFLLRRCRFRDAAAWPPTFSTTIFALGCLQTGKVLQAPALQLLGLGAGYAALVFWAVTVGWNVKCRTMA